MSKSQQKTIGLVVKALVLVSLSLLCAKCTTEPQIAWGFVFLPILIPVAILVVFFIFMLIAFLYESYYLDDKDDNPYRNY